MTIIAGGIDLSIPAVIGLSNIIMTQLYYKQWSLPVIFLAIAALAILIGTLNAVLSVLLHVHSLITSFGMSLIVSGVALEWSNGATTGAVPGWLTSSVSAIGHTGPIPKPMRSARIPSRRGWPSCGRPGRWSWCSRYPRCALPWSEYSSLVTAVSPTPPSGSRTSS
jgi:hypothetical protein